MIGYYVHHQGSGHMRTALRVLPYFSQPVVVLSSFPKPEFPSNTTFVPLEDDAVDGYEQPEGSLFMYTPNSPNLARRYRQILDAIERYGLTTMYVDVSMEVALFCKLLGLRVGHNVLLGRRDDTSHTLLFESCDFYASDNDPRLDALSTRNGPKSLEYVGGISRYKTRQTDGLGKVRNVLITVSPESDNSLPDDFEMTARSYPAITWHIVGREYDFTEPNIRMHGIVDDMAELYGLADVIVGAGGHNTIMEAASFGKPFVCIPEERPYEEQATAAKALAQNNMAVYRAEMPKMEEWDGIFEALRSVDLAAFQSIVDDGAAQRLATLIERRD